MTRRSAVVTVASALWCGVAAAEEAPLPRVEVREDREARRVEVTVDGQPFTAYVWPDRLAKPVVYPIRTAHGTLVTRGFPLDPRPGERVDHPHQVGFWFNFGDVNGVDFWGNSEAIGPDERARMGEIRHRKIVTLRSGSGQGELEALSEWLLPGGTAGLDEQTRFVFRAASGSRSIDRLATLTAKGAKVTFGDTKEGMLGLRVARALEHPADKPEVFTDASGQPTPVPVLDNAGVSGVYTSSEGLTGDAVWGTRARWMALAGRVGDEAVTLLLLDHPKNPGHPTYWHARGYGLFAANPFGAKAFTNGKAEATTYSLDAGARARFRHRLVILAGPFSAAKAEAAWQAFVTEHRD
jgi:hypothetical protein